MSNFIALAAVILSAVALAVVAYSDRESRSRDAMLKEASEVLITIDESQERRLNQIETFVYSGGGIDQRQDKNGGGVW